MKKLILVILSYLLCCTTFGYQQMLEMIALLEHKRSIETVYELRRSIDTVHELKCMADLELWYIEHTNPKIFIRIETADNATRMGYFRDKYRKANTFNKLSLLKSRFNLK